MPTTPTQGALFGPDDLPDQAEPWRLHSHANTPPDTDAAPDQPRQTGPDLFTHHTTGDAA